MKKLFSLLVLVATAVILVACGSGSSKTSNDTPVNNNPKEGTYYSFYKKSKEIGSVEAVVSGNTLTYHDHVYTIDTENGELKEGKESLPYEYKEDVITFDGISYVLLDSDTYNEMLEDGYED